MGEPVEKASAPRQVFQDFERAGLYVRHRRRRLFNYIRFRNPSDSNPSPVFVACNEILVLVPLFLDKFLKHSKILLNKVEIR